MYWQPASLPLYPKSPFSRQLFYKRNIIGNQVFSWAWRFKESLFDTELKAAQDYDIFLRMVVAYGEPWKIEAATQILHVNHGEMQITSSPKKFSGYFSFYRKHKEKFDRASKKYQLFTLYQIRNKRMTWKTFLTLLSVRNGKRWVDGLRSKWCYWKIYAPTAGACVRAAWSLLIVLLIFARYGARKTCWTICGQRRCWCCTALSPNASSAMKSRPQRPLADASPFIMATRWSSTRTWWRVTI